MPAKGSRIRGVAASEGGRMKGDHCINFGIRFILAQF